jgi:1-deoxy-D-xylulose-5-phosphate synthase
VCVQNLPVVFALDRSGVVGNDGETHQGVFDVAYLRTLPNMTIMSPKDENELRHMLFTGINHGAPIALRYPRGNGLGVALDTEFKELEIGKAEILTRGKDALCIAFGPLASSMQELSKKLLRDFGISVTVINARFAKPLDVELLSREIPLYSTVFTVEDHSLLGGFGSAVVECANDQGIAVQASIHRFGVQDAFVPHGSQDEQHAQNGYDLKSITDFVLQACARSVAAVG